MRARLAAVLLVVIAVTTPRRAAAWTLDYQAPEGCDDAAEFRARAEAQRASAGEAGGVRVELRSWRDAGASGRWRVRLVIDAGGPQPGVRELDGQSCREVTDAAALIVALAIDGALEHAPPAAAPTVAVVARPARVPAARDPDALVVGARAPSPPVSLALSAGAALDLGTLPAPAPGLRAELSLGWRRVWLSLGAVTWARVESLDADDEGVSASAWQAFVAGRAGVWRGLELGGAFEIGQLDARGVGVDTVISRTLGWQAAGASAAWRQPLRGNLELIFEVEGLWPFTRPRLLVDGEPRFTPGPCLRAGALVAWKFL